MVFAIHQHELALGTLVSLHPEPLSPLYPSRLSQITGFRLNGRKRGWDDLREWH